MSLDEIQAAIPHRAPFLLIDQIVEIGAERIVCHKTFCEEEPWFRGHFPRFPVTPGVLLCEAAMQAGALLLAHRAAFPSGSIPVVTHINDVRFRRMVRPGEQVTLDVRLKERLADAFFLAARVRVGNQLAVRFQFACTLVQPER